MPRAKQPNPASNRTDLLTPGAPGRKMEAPNQAYGRRTAQAQSQKMLPIGTPGQPTGVPAQPATPPPGSPEGQTASPGLDLASLVPSARQNPHWLRPTERPHEPITAGLASGPGPGPEALQGVGALAAAPNNENASLQSLLSNMAARPGASSILKVLASRAGAQTV